jgi:hypothetical protein
MFKECNFIIYGGQHHTGGVLDLQCTLLDDQQNYHKPYATNIAFEARVQFQDTP